MRAKLEITSAKIILLAISIKWPGITTSKKDTISRLDNLLSTLLQNDRLLLATQTSILYLSIIEKVGQLGVEIERLLACQHLAPGLRASILLQAASLEVRNRLYEDSEKHILQAELLLDNSDYSVNDMRIELVRLSRPSTDVDSRVQRLRSLHERAQLLRFPSFDLECLFLLAEIGFSVGWEGQQLAIAANLVSAKIAYSTGSQLIYFELQVTLLGRLNLTSTAFGKVIEAEGLLQSKLVTNVPSLRYLLCTALSLAYGRIGDHDLSFHYSEVALNSAKLTHSVDFVSAAMGNYINAMSNSKPTKFSPSEKRQAYLEAIEMDRSANLVDELIDKLLGLALLGIRNPVVEAADVADPRLQSTTIFEEARTLAKRLLDEKDDPSFLAKVCQQHGTLLMQQGQTNNAREELVEAVQLFVQKGKHFESAIASVQVGLCELKLWKESPARTEHFNAAQNRFKVAFDMFEILGTLDPAASAQFYIAHCWELGRKYVFPGPDRDEMSRECLESLQKAEMLRETIRLDLSILSGPEAIRRKQLFSASDLNQNIFRTALLVTYQQGMYSAAWDWIQMFKARSLSDLLGLGCLIPEHLSEQFRGKEELSRLLAQESEIVRSIESQDPHIRLQRRIELDTLRKEMRKYPALAELLDLRAGRSEKMSDLNWLFDFAPMSQDVVLVDWICVIDNVYLVVLDRKLQPSMERLSFSVQWLEKWASEHLPESLCQPENESPLRQLDQLILPLSFLVKPGSVLVLSPSGPLHSIPLHALRLPNGRLLIENNPVVYSPSLSILHHCMLRTFLPRPTEITMAAFGAYEEPSFEDASSKEVKTSLSEYINLFGGTFLYRDEVTKSAFNKEASKASIIHFHGHTRGSNRDILERGIEVYLEHQTTPATDLNRTLHFNTRNLKNSGMLQSLEQYLESSQSFKRRETTTPRHSLGNESDDESDNDDFDGDTIPRCNPHAILSVRDIFAIKLPAPVVSLIACKSARDEISAGDEPLGLISAFLYAGSTSVVGTLWPIRSSDGRDFSNEFYKQIKSQSPHVENKETADTATSFVDLALSLRQAILKIRERDGLGDPFHWAAFVLYGAWLVQPF